MKGGTGGGTAGGANVQAAAEAGHPRIVACEVTNAPTDRDGRSPLAVEAAEGLGGPCDAAAERGDSRGQEGKQGLPAGMTPSSARPITSANPTLGRCSPDDGTDEAAPDPDGCPAGEERRVRFATVARGRPLRD
jgi:hypothetical protein